MTEPVGSLLLKPFVWLSKWTAAFVKGLLILLCCIFITQGFRSSPAVGGVSFGNGGIMGGLDVLRQVEAKYPALLFKQQLTAYVEKIYGMIRDNLKKEISPLLSLCIQVGDLFYQFLVRA